MLRSIELNSGAFFISVFIVIVREANVFEDDGAQFGWEPEER
jgi:hypothetical protein